MPGSPVRSLWLRTLSRQLGHPSGLLGSVVVRQLNQRNAAVITAAVSTLECRGGETAADIGYGGGVGLTLLLDAVGTEGHVHGVEPAKTMVQRARRQLGDEVAAGRLSLHEATMDDLPFADGELDRWMSLNTIYFVDDLEPSFVEMARVLSPTGRGVVGMADPDWMSQQPFAQQGFTVRPLDEVVQALTSAGLDVSVETLHEAASDIGYHLLVCTPVASAQ